MPSYRLKTPVPWNFPCENSPSYLGRLEENRVSRSTSNWIQMNFFGLTFARAPGSVCEEEHTRAVEQSILKLTSVAGSILKLELANTVSPTWKVACHWEWVMVRTTNGWQKYKKCRSLRPWWEILRASGNALLIYMGVTPHLTLQPSYGLLLVKMHSTLLSDDQLTFELIVRLARFCRATTYVTLVSMSLDLGTPPRPVPAKGLPLN